MFMRWKQEKIFIPKRLLFHFENDIYHIQFKDGYTQQATLYELKIYFPCNCDDPLTEEILNKYISSSGQPINCKYTI